MSKKQHVEDQPIKSLTLSGMTLPHLLLIILSVGVVIVSIYMTNHFFNEHFPTTLGSDSNICNLSSFWSCDSATFSSLSQIALVPISLFSLLLGIYFLIHSIFASKESEQTGKFLATINFIGCLALLLFSLFSLGSLCPICTFYYILSIAIFALFYLKSSLSPIPSLKISAIWLVVLAAMVIGVRSFHQNKINVQESINAQIVEQFFKLPVGKQPDVKFGKNLLRADSTDAPIKIAMFSDFQCPYCKLLAEDIEKAAKQFPGKVEATYFFYPLDANCNPSVKSAFHAFACQASYVSYCSEDFKEAHDFIYKNQANFSADFFSQYIEENHLESCVDDEDTQKEIVASIMYGDSEYQVKATPTLIINGVRLKPLPKSQFLALFKAILSRTK